EYGEELLLRLGRDLTARFGRGFADRSLRKMRAFYLGWEIWPTPSANLQAKVKFQTVSGKSTQAIWPTPLAKSESEISPTPSAKLQARVKWQTVSADSGAEKAQTVSALSESKILPTLSAKLQPITPHQLPLDPTQSLTDVFPLPWSHYVRLMSVR